MASIVPPRARTSRSFRRLSLIAAGVATSLALMGASLAALTGNVLTVTHWSSSHDESTKGQLLPDIPQRSTPGTATASGSGSDTFPGPGKTSSSATAVTTPPPAATSTPTPLPVSGGTSPSVAVSPRIPTAGDGTRAPQTSHTGSTAALPSSVDSDGDGLTNAQEKRLG